jgi:dTDP-4-dehydrorhamnose reductase
MKILITGHGGLLAQAVHRAAGEAGAEVVALTEEQLDITDEQAVGAAVQQARPDAVINCAAWVNAETAQSNPDGARAVNADGAGILAAAAAAVDASIIYPSTDYVFDGEKGEPYVESDEPGPLSVYGETKLGGEQATAAANPRHFITRTAWLYGPGGRNFPDTMLRLASEGADIKVVNDQIGCPTYTRHLAAALVELAAGEEFGIHHVAGATVCSWYDLACEVFRLAGSDYPVRPCPSSEYPLQAPRPSFSALASTRPETPRLPSLEAGLTEHLAARAG